MAHLRHNSAAPFQVPRPTTATNMDEIDTCTTHVDPSSKIRQVRWNDDMDGFMIAAIVHEVLADKNVRARLKTLKKEYAEVSQLLSISGFGWDAESGRITVDSLAWDDLVKGKPDFENGGRNSVVVMMKWSLFLETIQQLEIGPYQNSIISHLCKLMTVLTRLTLQLKDTDPSPNPTRKRHADEGTTTGRRKRRKPYEDSDRSLALIAGVIKKIAEAIHMQATLDTLNHVN
ncbi:Uncharacterized protein Adt_20356 [Abeliophyllum distichum]|uniref:Myb/SANT-like domain-containing protein n=1 Tax=Abeliophyllum distichum TaxID=126358 RepID=A0ABD1SWB4_9LAMI